MGRRGSKIIPFLMEGLASGRYANLQYVNEARSVFSLLLPRKTRKLDAKYECLLKDWRSLKNQSYKYTKAKQAIESALKKSVFLEQLPMHGDIWKYRILNNDEIKEKKRLLKELATVKKEFSNPTSVGSSGYGSGGDSPAAISSPVGEEVVSLAIKQEHAYSLLTEVSYISSLNGETDTFPVQEDITIGENEVHPIMEVDSDNLNELLHVDPNSIIIDNRNSPSSNFNHQSYDTEAMEFDDREVTGHIEDKNLFDFNHTFSNTYSDYLGSEYDLQTAFEDFPFEKATDEVQLNKLVKSLFPGVGNSSLLSLTDSGPSSVAPLCGSSSAALSTPCVDPNLGIPMQSTKVYRFKENKFVNNGEMWIFEPQVLEMAANGSNENDPGSPKMIIDDKEIRILQSSKRIESIEFNPVTDHISVFLKHAEIL